MLRNNCISYIHSCLANMFFGTTCTYDINQNNFVKEKRSPDYASEKIKTYDVISTKYNSNSHKFSFSFTLQNGPSPINRV